jgi:hypothetical protein
MRGIHVIVIGLLFLLIGARATAEEQRDDGNELLQKCSEVPKEAQSRNGLSAMWCYGYIEGIRDMRLLNETVDSIPPDCTPQKVTMDQMARVVVKYLQDHPERLHYMDASLVVNAISEAFPCPVQPAAK